MVKRDLRRTLAIVIGISLCGIAAAFAYPTPTADEISTCTPDALRLCGGVIFSGRIAVFRCMRANKHRLSAECRVIFVRHGL